MRIILIDIVPLCFQTMSNLPWGIIHLDECASTNEEAQKYVIYNTFKHPLVFVAQHQTLGRGQSGSVWYDEPGKNILCSLLLPTTNLTIRQLPLLNMFLSAALVNALQSVLSAPVAMKWPNDILLNGYKIGGVLMETSLQGSKIHHVIFGFGINVDYAPEKVSEAMALRNFIPDTPKNDVLLTKVLEVVQRKYQENAAIDRAHENYESLLAGLKQWLFFRHQGILKKAFFHGVDEAGRARIQWENESEIALYQQKEISWDYELNRRLIF